MGTRSVADQWDILWGDIKEVAGDVWDAGGWAYNELKDAFETDYQTGKANWFGEGDGGLHPGDDRLLEWISKIIPGWDHTTRGEREEAEEEEEATIAQEQVLRDEVAEANRIVSELLGPDRNWQRFFNFLTNRSVMVIGPGSQVDTLREIYDAVSRPKVTGLDDAQGQQELNLNRASDVALFKEILATPAIFIRQFGQSPDQFPGGQAQQMIDSYVESVAAKTNTVVIGGVAAALLSEIGDTVVPDEQGRLVVPSSDPDHLGSLDEDKGATVIAGQDFVIPSFDGTQQGVIRSVGDLVSGLSLNPQEVQMRLNELPSDQLALVQAQLWQLGYFVDANGNVEDFTWGRSTPADVMSPTGSATYRALERMLVGLVGAMQQYGPDYSIDTLLTDRRKQRSLDMRGEYINSEVDLERSIRDSVIQEASGAMNTAAFSALQAAAEASGVKITAAGQEAFKENLQVALDTVGLTQPEVDSIIEENQRSEDVEKLLTAFYTNGSFVGDWSENVFIGNNSDSDWADFGLMAGVITPEEADLLYSAPSAAVQEGQVMSSRALVRQKLAENQVEIVRTAMQWWLDQQTFIDAGTQERVVSHVDALRGFGNTIGRFSSSINEYDDNTFQRLSESLTSDPATDWLLAQPEQPDTLSSVTDRIAQSAVDALGLPDEVSDISGAGSIRSVLRAISQSGSRRSMRYG